MKYNFDTIFDRRNTNSLKWNVKENELAMWVADMDFQSPPCVQEAIRTITELGIYGYSDIPQRYYMSYQKWWKNRYAYHMDIEWMMFSSGVVPAISSIIRRLTSPAEKVLVLAPVYNIFYNSILNNGREVISSELVYEDGIYRMDEQDLEAKLSDPQTTMMILCNPHNPIGKVWSIQELCKIGELCMKYHVIVLSDEVHCDLSAPNVKYTPFAKVNNQYASNCITCLSASKAFNLAGLQSACVVVEDKNLRHKVWRGLNNDEVAEPNIFACEASIAAFEKGEEWLEQLREYIEDNKQLANHFIQKNIPLLKVVPSDATYLLWIDCCELAPFVDQFVQYLKEEKGLLVSNGSIFGKSGENFIRINIACPKERMLDGLHRLKLGYDEFLITYVITC